MFETVVRVRGQLGELVAALDPDAVSGSAARELWGEFDRIERLGSAGKTLLARRIAQTHQRSGSTRTAAEELARRGGTSAGQVNDSLATSHRLPDQPELEQALRGGELSPAQAALISDAAAADPGEAGRLTDLAHRVSLAELREECARVKAAADPDPDATNRRIHAQRRLRHYTDAEGGWNLTARGTAQAGAALLTVLNAITDAIFQQARRDGRAEPVEAYAFDALMTLAQHVAGGGDQPADAAPETSETEPPNAPAGASGTGVNTPSGSDQARPRSSKLADTLHVAGGGEPGSFRNPGRPECPLPASRWSNPRYLALLRIDAAALRRGHVEGGEMCELAGIGPVPVSVARDLLGESILKLVITDGVDVQNVTHLGRGPTAAQRAALMWMNPTCAVLGCSRTRIEWDHREPWAKTHHTRLDELDPLCAFHHDLKTRLGYALVDGVGKRAFVAPDDPRHPRHRPARAAPAASNNGARSSAPTRTSPTKARSRSPRQSPLPIQMPGHPQPP
jgi:hypothetical protein